MELKMKEEKIDLNELYDEVYEEINSEMLSMVSDNFIKQLSDKIIGRRIIVEGEVFIAENINYDGDFITISDINGVLHSYRLNSFIKIIGE